MDKVCSNESTVKSFHTYDRGRQSYQRYRQPALVLPARSNFISIFLFSCIKPFSNITKQNSPFLIICCVYRHVLLHVYILPMIQLGWYSLFPTKMIDGHFHGCPRVKKRLMPKCSKKTLRAHNYLKLEKI